MTPTDVTALGLTHAITVKLFVSELSLLAPAELELLQPDPEVPVSRTELEPADARLIEPYVPAGMPVWP